MRELRPHQARAIEQLRDALRSGSKRPLVQAPTGAGKTVLAAAIIDLGRQKGSRTIFTVPAIELVDQTVREFYAEGIRDVGVIQADHHLTDPSKPVQIASLSTLRRRSIPDADIVIVDEAHRQSEFLADWMERPEWLGVPFIGLSATPWSKGLGRFYDRLIVAATTAELIDKRFLSPFRVFAPAHPDLSGVRVVAGDYHEGDLAEAMGKGTLVADIVTTWKALGEDRPTLCFGVDRAHAKTIQAEFLHAGVPCGYLDAHSTREERRAVRQQFQAGELKVVCNVGVLTTGVDWDVRCVILARPTKSEILYTQIIGRGLRTAAGKADCLILDHSDTTLRLGFVTDIHHDKLCDGSPASKQHQREAVEAKPRECPVCHYVRAPKVRECPSCGHVGSVRSEVETVDGELIDLTAERRRLNKANKDDWSDKVAFMSQIKAVQIERGKSDGWASYQYKNRYGVWPNDHRVKFARPAAFVSPEVRSWLKSQAIRYAKSQQRRTG